MSIFNNQVMMHFKANKIKLLLSVFLLLGCTHEKGGNNVNTTDINPNETDKYCVLSELVDDIKVISLENSPESLIGYFSELIYLDTENIIYESENTLIIFDGKGNYKNKITSIGKGPQEYTEILDVFVDTYSKHIHIVDYSGIKIYDFTGQYVKSINTKLQFSGVFKSKDGNYILSAAQTYKEKNRDILYIYDANFKKIHTFKSKNKEILNVRQDIIPVGGLYKINDEIFYKTAFMDTIFKVKDTVLEPHWSFSLGEFKMTIAEQLNTSEFLRARQSNNKIQLINLSESPKYFFITYIFNKQKHFSVLKKETNEFVFHANIPLQNNENYDGEIELGIKNDLINNAPPFKPSYINDYTIVSINSPVYLNKSQLKLFNCKEDDNPLLFVANLKK